MELHGFGVVKKNGRTFWDTLRTGNAKPFRYHAAGSGQIGKIIGHKANRDAFHSLIPGFSYALFAGGGIKVGEVREVDIKPDDAYGPAGLKERGIFPNSSLLLRIKCVCIHSAESDDQKQEL